MGSAYALREAQRESRARLHPSLTNPNWLVLRRRRKIFEGGISRLPVHGLSVLDVGGRLQPYRALLGERVEHYVAVDVQASSLVTVCGAAEALPFPTGQFDFVICTQVLEYLQEPGVAIAEIWRVLRSGGLLFLSAPAVFLRDHEREYWRFLPPSLRLLLREFDAVDVFPEGNSVTGLVRTVNVVLNAFVRPRILAPVWRWTLVPLLNLAGYVLEGLGGSNDDFAANYSVWARK
jgi:SAM-dependent methyltransferase